MRRSPTLRSIALLVLVLVPGSSLARPAKQAPHGFTLPENSAPFRSGPAATETGFAPGDATVSRSTTSLAALPVDPAAMLARITGNGGPTRGPLTAERAQVMLQSLTVPGWGQLTTGHPHAATVFGVIDLGIWTSFVAFEVQQNMRTDSSIRTAREFAGIDLSGSSEEYRRIVGSYPSSNDYNILVVFRDAAALWYNDPVKYREYIDQHQVTGPGSWAWVSPESYGRYQAQRKDAQRAGLRANTALALAIANRLISAIHAAGIAGHLPASHSLRFQVTPDFSSPVMAVRCGLTSNF